MKIVSSWPDYSIPAIVAVTDTGAVFTLPIAQDLLHGALHHTITDRWHRCTAPIKALEDAR